MIKNCWQHDERLTYWILEDYIDDVYQLSLASRKGGLYVERIQKRQNLKHNAPYYWQEDTTFANLTREKIEGSMRNADRFNASQAFEQLSDEEQDSQQCIAWLGQQRQTVPYTVEKIDRIRDWLMSKCYFMLLPHYVCLLYVIGKVTIL